MPLRDDLLKPIEGDNPSGTNLQYDVKVFDLIKEARQEDDESIPTGNWGRAPKKADRALVIKTAGDALATRSKDLRLAGWYLESLIRKEGFAQLAPGLEFLRSLQTDFWDTIYPEKDPDDGSLDLRIGAIELFASLLGTQIRLIPLTRSGINLIVYQDARALGMDADSRSDDKEAIRKDAIARGRLRGDDVQQGVEQTPKAFYADTEAYLVKALEVLDELDRDDEEKYGDDYPALGKLKTAITDVKTIVTGCLNEKRKTEPDPVEAAPVEEVAADEEEAESAEGEEAGAAVVARAPGKAAVGAKRAAPVGAPTDKEGAYLQVAACAEFLMADANSPVPYLLCTALRFGETRAANLQEFTFAVAPPTEVRQTMRKLATEEKWGDLLRLCMQTLPEPCARVWLDLQRYTWLAARGLEKQQLADTVASTLRSLLTDFPMVRSLTLDDDTSAANPQTQRWIDSDVMQ
jgi:type VI secretion system protein ImpA